MHPTTLHLPVKILHSAAAGRDHLRPTCLHAVYRYWGEDARLPEVIARIRKKVLGGTFAIFLAAPASG